MRERGRGRPGCLRGGLVVVLLLVGLRVGAAPAERCPEVGVPAVRASAERAVEWFGATQQPDGSFTYLLTEDGRDLGDYNVVRHAGVLLSLEQAAAAGIEAARPIAARGTAWAFDRLEPAGGGRALADDGGSIRTGASALLVRALLERGDEADRDELRDLGAFLAGQVYETGGVAAGWDPVRDEPAGEPNQYFTGEAYWALIGLDDHHDAVARIGSYLPTRDQVEDRFPPVADHWSAYSYDALGRDALTDEQHAHAERLAGLFGLQVRGESTRWEGGLQGRLRGGPATGSGLGTLGEGSAALVRLYGDDAPDGLVERVRCTAGMLVERQADDGAWYTDGVTRMDDQQHALSALLGAIDVSAIAPGVEAIGGGAQSHSLLWLFALAVAVANPARPGRRSSAGLTAAVALLLVWWSGPILDQLDISPASARVAAGVAAVVAAIGVLAAPAAPSMGSLVTAAVLAVAVSVGADDGASAILPIAFAALVTLAWPRRSPMAARLFAAALVYFAVDLVVDGILGI